MRRRDWAAAVLGGLALAVAIFAVGSAFRWTQAIVAVLVAAALAAQLPARRVIGRKSPLVVALGIAAGLTVISLIPMPSGLRAAVDPVGTALRDDGASLLDLSPWPGWTRDAPGSLRGLVFFVILLGTALVVLRLAVSERGRYGVLATVAAACGLTAIVTGIHELFGATRLYGIYQMHARPNILGPLLNENHLGGLMAVGACVAVGLVLYRRQRSWLRAMWLVVVVICGAAAAASRSRGVFFALPIGALVTAGVMIGQRFTATEQPKRRRGRFATNSLPIAVVAVCVVVVVVYSSAGRVTERLDNTSFTEEAHRPGSKIAAWRSAKSLIEESPWIGVGRGGFEPSFTRVHPIAGSVTFAYVENEYIQAVVDWGIPGAVVLGLAIIWFCSVAIRRWRDGALAAGAIGGLSAIALQSNVDFGVELLGLAIPVTAVAATLAYVPLREVSARALVTARALRLGHIAALLAGAGLLMSTATTSIEEDHARLVEHPTLAGVRASLERHPLDFYGYALAAELTERTGDPRSVRLLNHAMRLHPTLPDLHRIAAKLLIRGGHVEQATIEYAAAVHGTAEPRHLIGEIAAAFTPEQAALALPADLDRMEQMVAILRDLKHEDIAILWMSRVLEAHPQNIRACNLLYELAVSRGDLQAATAAGRSCVELMPDRQTRLALARVLLAKQGYQEVIRLLDDAETWQGRIDDKVEGWLTLCDAYAGLERWDNATQCLHRLDASGDVTPANRAAVMKRLDAIAQQRREHDLAGSAR